MLIRTRHPHDHQRPCLFCVLGGRRQKSASRHIRHPAGEPPTSALLKDLGPAALRAIQPDFERGLVKDLFCADRGITQAKPHNLHLQLLKLGLNSVKHYNDDKVDRQGEFRGMQLVGGEFYCPLMPTRSSLQAPHTSTAALTRTAPTHST
ncbi:hypothetical protein RVR_8427 [Actinacidiphila reveromycinica]|uniref:Uncharacterized protein n=1 Tax=Actinacidiphila reveromycinica TaxID=659352 RepID=A0A7U3UYJ2_9ACTN|nr:hypothetical protein [Streptomyces sp. SN-593]BBB01156.1 hypothetical protein RVR_8427 [Streptomyces sp. SN-593]